MMCKWAENQQAEELFKQIEAQNGSEVAEVWLEETVHEDGETREDAC